MIRQERDKLSEDVEVDETFFYKSINIKN